MSTRGTLKVNGRYYYMRSGSHAARRVLKIAMKTSPRNPREFVKAANDIADFEWLIPMTGMPKFRGSILEEYVWTANLKTKRVSGGESPQMKRAKKKTELELIRKLRD